MNSYELLGSGAGGTNFNLKYFNIWNRIGKIPVRIENKMDRIRFDLKISDTFGKDLGRVENGDYRVRL